MPSRVRAPTSLPLTTRPTYLAACRCVAYPPHVDRRDDYTALLEDQARIDRDERAEALILLRTGHAVRVWRHGSILVLTSFADIDRVWPRPTYPARGGAG